MSRELTYQDVIDDIDQALQEADGDWISYIYELVCTDRIKYLGDSVWQIKK